jgi:hypothetical protein
MIHKSKPIFRQGIFWKEVGSVMLEPVYFVIGFAWDLCCRISSNNPLMSHIQNSCACSEISILKPNWWKVKVKTCHKFMCCKACVCCSVYRIWSQPARTSSLVLRKKEPNCYELQYVDKCSYPEPKKEATYIYIYRLPLHRAADWRPTR